jgi:hypothetical protein
MAKAHVRDEADGLAGVILEEYVLRSAARR